MPKIRHLAFRCKDPQKIGEFLHEAFGLEILYVNEDSGTAVLSDGETNITLNTERFEYPWHFGLEMSLQEIGSLRSQLGQEMHQGVADGRPVEAFALTSEGHRVDMAPFWPTKPGQRRRQTAPADGSDVGTVDCLAKIRHIAFCCQDPRAIADFLQETFDLDILYHTGPYVTVMSDGNINLTLLPESFMEHDPVPWHFGIEMPLEEIERRRLLLEQMGVEMHEGVPDGRPVEQYVHTPEGHRIDLSAYWPTKQGQPRRLQERVPSEAATASP